MRKSTQEEFIAKAREVHGEKYDYSKVEYINNRTKVCIICPIHGEFWQTPSNHLHGYECKECGRFKSRRKIFGVGINDYKGFIYDKETKTIKKFYRTWYEMLRRCYDENYKKSLPTYKNCKICDDWIFLSAFKKWFDENYIEGYELDKDLLVSGNKTYSPETCCFVPHCINSFLANKQEARINVTGTTVRFTKNQARATLHSEQKNLGLYENIEEAREAYKKERELYAKKLANEYKNYISAKAYNALINYREQ